MKLNRHFLTLTHTIPSCGALNKPLIFSVLLFRLYNAGSPFSPSCPALYVVFVSNNPYQGSCLLGLCTFAFRIGAKPDPDLGLCLWVPPRNPCWNLFMRFPSADVFPSSLYEMPPCAGDIFLQKYVFISIAPCLQGWVTDLHSWISGSTMLSQAKHN